MMINYRGDNMKQKQDNKINFAILGIVGIVGIVVIAILFVGNREDATGNAWYNRGPQTNWQASRTLTIPPTTSTQPAWCSGYRRTLDDYSYSYKGCLKTKTLLECRGIIDSANRISQECRRYCTDCGVSV